MLSPLLSLWSPRQLPPAPKLKRGLIRMQFLYTIFPT